MKLARFKSSFIVKIAQLRKSHKTTVCQSRNYVLVSAWFEAIGVH